MRSSLLRLGALTVLIGAANGGCGSDDATPGPNDTGVVDTGGVDTGTSDVATDTGDDGAVPFDCSGKADGTNCGGSAICVKGVCAGSSCGDGYVDPASGEDCDDSNATSGDGCSACHFDCKAPADCDDASSCNGVELCNTVTHRCEAGTKAADGTACTLAGGAGTCKSGACVAAGCGNAVKDGTEDCDDGNADDADGCTKLCKFTCAAAADCDDANKCNGDETCNTTTHKCAAGTAITCTPKAGCTGTCAPTTGACAYPDADADGVACDADCIDTDPAVFPGAYECKDGKDNDCSAATADGTAPSCLCYADGDKDGYAASGAATISSSGTCPTGYTRRAPVDAATTDCGSFSSSVYPGQKDWYASSYCKVLVMPGGSCSAASSSFDYDCSGAAEQRYKTASTTSCPGAPTLLACIMRSGWIGAVPACGGSGSYRSCTWGGSSCSGAETSRKQECH